MEETRWILPLHTKKKKWEKVGERYDTSFKRENLEEKTFLDMYRRN